MWIILIFAWVVIAMRFSPIVVSVSIVAIFDRRVIKFLFGDVHALVPPLALLCTAGWFWPTYRRICTISVPGMGISAILVVLFSGICILLCLPVVLCWLWKLVDIIYPSAGVSRLMLSAVWVLLCSVICLCIGLSFPAECICTHLVTIFEFIISLSFASTIFLPLFFLDCYRILARLASSAADRVPWHQSLSKPRHFGLADPWRSILHAYYLCEL